MPEEGCHHSLVVIIGSPLCRHTPSEVQHLSYGFGTLDNTTKDKPAGSDRSKYAALLEVPMET